MHLSPHREDSLTTVTVFCYALLRRNRFLLQVPPPQRLTVTAPSSEEMDGTHRKTSVSRSSSVQESRLPIQILQEQANPVLELVNQEGNTNATTLDATVNVHPSAVMVTTLPLPPPP